ncbi:protein refolding chaperone Spy/CpxP family [Enhydrobacter aerosaccus]|uniref:Protein refolding chaperone Spy/CpxP family n=1 Tax=Enhydrobacter aerosaccus TaxID=225324 RepID=A0A1T4S2H3_9HYPH|nr:periplasmic heavy metal sensor [Enhydrobacter aerosaccus]SKA22276.1 protein refolding chaperone Spy/CpxP family [Enhydrobacter aerosaccus]
MSSRLTQVLLGLSLLLNCFVLAGFVYRSWIEPPAVVQPGPRPAPGRSSPLEMLSQDVNLDASQRQALKETFDSYASARHERFLEIQSIRHAMADELRKPEFDMSQINGLVDQMTKLRAEQQKENLAAIAELANHLRPDQRDRLHTILADRYGGPPGWRGPNGTPPPPPGPARPSQ